MNPQIAAILATYDPGFGGAIGTTSSTGSDLLNMPYTTGGNLAVRTAPASLFAGLGADVLLALAVLTIMFLLLRKR